MSFKKTTKLVLLCLAFLALQAPGMLVMTRSAVAATTPAAGTPTPGTTATRYGNNPDLSPGDCRILQYAVDAINLLSALAGIVVVIMIAVGGIQYSAARDNPQATQAAKQKIQNAIIALLAFLFMYGFLQYIIPGGVL